MKIIAYTRVSTDVQAEHGLGLQMQSKAIAAWARAGGHKVIASYSDKGVSGANGLDSRPGLAQALSALHAGKADALAVYRLDRLSRKLAHQETWIEQLEQAGRSVVSVTEPEYGDDEIRTLVRQILGAVAQYERVVIRNRLQGGRKTKAERGGFAYGSPPYGWRAEDGALVPVQAEQDVLGSMRTWREAGQSLRMIAGRLNADAVPTKRGTGTRWHPATVAKALARPDAAAGG